MLSNKDGRSGYCWSQSRKFGRKRRKGLIASNGAVLDAVIAYSRETQYPWLIACDANMEPDVFVKGKWFDERTVILRVPGRSERPG